ncbi:MAG: diphosphomevalonate decarboxylase [Gammaproteobacteria bacterium]|nr:diphosphomevalonate decarboxylase [Gammaproteobacteria bacterium]MDE0413747.1 diphosphomevalonate decarboxylase [Gammaproteobacteria bacterium]
MSSEDVMQGSAIAHPNVALVKYWGKRPARGNLPAMGSLSLSLGFLATRTTVRFDPDGGQDTLTLNGRRNSRDLKRMQDCLAPLRRRAAGSGSATADSRNDFPTGAGLASSASGMAALALAGASALGLADDLDLVGRSAMAGSGSAPRSLHGGVVLLSIDPEGSWSCKSLLRPEEWPLKVAVAVTQTGPKQTDSRSGMELTRRTSPFYRAWLGSQKADLEDARRAVAQRDFGRLAELSEGNCLRMHAAAMGATPPLMYFNGATVECMHRVRALARDGRPVFFTVDAGPQVKAVCLAGVFDEVCDALGQVPGVQQVLGGELGGGARLIPG